jgi:hypothetical protein
MKIDVGPGKYDLNWGFRHFPRSQNTTSVSQDTDKRCALLVSGSPAKPWSDCVTILGGSC